MFSFVSIFPLTSTHVLTEKYPLPSRLHYQKYQQAFQRVTQEAVQNPERAITTAVKYRILPKPTTKFMPSSLAILWVTICIAIRDIPSEPLTFQSSARRRQKFILGDPGAVSGGRKKSKQARKNSGEERSAACFVVGFDRDLYVIAAVIAVCGF